MSTANQSNVRKPEPGAGTQTRPTVLVVDDEVRSQETIRRVLEEEFDVLECSSAVEAEGLLEREWIQIVLCDQRMPKETGVEFLTRVRERWPDVVRIIISGYTDSEDIISGVNEAGIYQYITKPWNPETLLLTVRGAARLCQLQRENQALNLELKVTANRAESQVAVKREDLRRRFEFDRLIRAPGSSLNTVCELAQKIAPHDISLLIMGESGTGKELLARAVHYSSPRSDKPFVTENCGALPDQLLESELFGYKKGAFTGAYTDRIGLFDIADGGTVFLDEIGDISPAFQVKLLRVLQEGEIRPLGSARTRKVDVRVVAATNRNLKEEVRSGRFREDLYYRLAGFSLEMPALRHRPEDIPLIATHLFESGRARFGNSVEGFTPETMQRMRAYNWPGNVRELGNEIQRMLALTEGPLLDADLLSFDLSDKESAATEVWIGEPDLGGGDLRNRVEQLERKILYETLLRHRWNKSRAAEELGLSRVGLRAKLRRYELEPATDRAHGRTATNA